MLSEHHIKHDWDKFEKYCLKRIPGLPTGYKCIDKLIIGLPGLVTLMGEPKCCKSTVALNVAIHNAKKGHPVLFIDKENGLQRTRKRLLSAVGGLTAQAIDSHNFTKEEKLIYDDTVEEVHNLPFYYYADIDEDSLSEAVKEACRKHKKKCLVVADSVQSLIQNFTDRRSSVDYWIYLFNNLKIKYENYVTILAVSEKRREAYGISSRSGAKESGGIEYKSEMVLDLYLDKDDPNLIHVNCNYNRDGDTGYICILQKSIPYTYTLTDEAGMVPD